MLMKLEGLYTYEEAKTACADISAKIFEPAGIGHTEAIWELIDANGQALFWSGINDVVDSGKKVKKTDAYDDTPAFDKATDNKFQKKDFGSFNFN